MEWIYFLIAAILTVIIVAWIIHDNRKIDVTEYDIYDKNLPEGFDGMRIVQISDFHNSLFGKNNSKLIGLIKDARPDSIFITGDFLDSRKTKFRIAENFAKELSGISSVYYCAGNHESRIPNELKKLETRFRRFGICSLRNRSVVLRRDGSRLQIIGVDDIDFDRDKSIDYDERIEQFIKRIADLNDPDMYSILLSHKPEIFNKYHSTGVNLVFSGHAHGGQVRLPFIGPLFSPNQGLFPEYAQGVRKSDGMTMVISRGLGQSIIPFRINNSPELVIAVLHKEN